MQVLSSWKHLLDPMGAAGMPFPAHELTDAEQRRDLTNDEFTELYRWFHARSSPRFDYQGAADFIEEHFYREHFS